MMFETTSRRCLRSVATLLLLSFVSTSFAGEGLPWVHKFEEAQAKAKKEKKDLFINFTGSDWCGWCKRLDAEVFTQGDFAKTAGKDFIFVFIDFPKAADLKAKVPDPKSNEELQKKYGVQGFPTILLTDAEGRVYGRTGYQEGGPEKYLASLTKFREGGEKIKALLDNKKKNKQVELLKAALPVLAEQDLLDLPEYKDFLDQAKKLDAKGEHGLLPIVLGHEENKALLKLVDLPRGQAPDWNKVNDQIKASKHANGRTFGNITIACADWLRKQKRHADAKTLYERLLTDPAAKDDPRVQAGLKDCEEQLKKS
ncbi:MAG: thioredoxin family protein [Planctomycetota bacterium]